ncbi:hypothetical protein [Pedobacter miscanthi]|uniref:hypothetical protein n=1 Tax=Pedobacter miscanthi TaxID=2259170 RepID=UPI002930792F|nr:hypothetical protein [Pedobacter miscanthi]
MSTENENVKNETEVKPTVSANQTIKKENKSKPQSKPNNKAKKTDTKKTSKVNGKGAKTSGTSRASTSNYPRNSIEKSLRIPKAIIDQNAGKECSNVEAAKFVGYSGVNGVFMLEVSSAVKYGFLYRPNPNQLAPTELAKQILRPQSPDDELNGYRQALLNAPVVSDVYKHYRGENLPDTKFFSNALTETFKVPAEKIPEFMDILIDSLFISKLAEKKGDKIRVLDISSEKGNVAIDTAVELKKLSKSAGINSGDSCFVMMPFAPPLGDYYSKIYEPAIRKAGLTPIRADNEIFGTGKIIDQIWSGITSAKVLIAELTSRNANVFYELGLAHALKKPVVLVSSNQEDVPFDLKHIRVIYYDMHDPFWGNKLIEKVAENILSAIANPEETILFNP